MNSRWFLLQNRKGSLVFLVSCCLFLASCAGVRPYSLSPNDLEGYTRQAFKQFDQEQLAQGSPLSLTLKDLNITIGPNGREIVQLDVSVEAAVNLFLMKVPAQMYLKMEGQPFYDGKEKAVYIRRLALLDSKVESSLFQSQVEPATKQVISMLGKMLEQAPVYRLNENNFAEKMLMAVPINLKVVPGRITFELISH